MPETWMVLYQDEGPNGVCGQCMSVTSRWTHLHVFDDHDAMLTFCEQATANRGRLRPKVTLVNSIFIHQGENEYEFEAGEPLAVNRRVATS